MSPLHLPTLPESRHRAMPLSPAPARPRAPQTPRALHPGPPWRPPPERLKRPPLLHTPQPCHSSPAHSNFLFKKLKLPTDSLIPLFLWRTLPYTLLQMMNTVYCVCFKVLFNCSLLPVLVTHLPHACFQFRVWGGNDEHINFFFSL